MFIRLGNLNPKKLNDVIPDANAADIDTNTAKKYYTFKEAKKLSRF